MWTGFILATHFLAGRLQKYVNCRASSLNPPPRRIAALE